MKNFNGGGGFRKGGDFGGGKRFGGGQNRNREHSGHGKFGGGKSNDFHGGGNRNERSFDAPQLFAAVCSTCGKGCEVPFRPSADKPVYCSACFGKKKHDGERDGRDSARVPEFKREDAKAVHAEKPVRFDSDEKYGALSKQLITLEAKVSMILELLGTQKASPKAVPEEKASKVTTLKVVKKTAAKKTEKKTKSKK